MQSSPMKKPRQLRAAALSVALVAAACGTSTASSSADSGTCGPTIASASGACFDCVRAHCATAAAACDSDCRCRSDFVACAPSGDGMAGCGRLDQLHAGNTYNLFIEVESCTFTNTACKSVCGATDAGADASTD